MTQVEGTGFKNLVRLLKQWPLLMAMSVIKLQSLKKGRRRRGTGNWE